MNRTAQPILIEQNRPNVIGTIQQEIMSSGETDMNDVPVLSCYTGEVTEWIAIQRGVSKPWNFRPGRFYQHDRLGCAQLALIVPIVAETCQGRRFRGSSVSILSRGKQLMTSLLVSQPFRAIPMP